ncbi:MAG: DUF308 domain-containing protein [Myxococcota bacterium]
MNEGAQVVKRASRSGIAFGILVVLMGILAIALPLAGGLAVTAVVAAVLVISGICQTVFAFSAPTFGRGLLAFLFGAITAVAGIVVFQHPTFGLTTLTIAVIAYFIVDGIYHLIAFFQLSGQPGRGWFLFGGLVSLALAAMLWADFPSSAEWAIGLLVGIRLLMTGWMMIVLNGAASAAARDAASGAT